MLIIFLLLFQILSVSTDNASSNSTFTKSLAEKTKDQLLPFDIDNWIRCFAHIINIGVQAALLFLKLLLEKVSLNCFLFIFQT